MAADRLDVLYCGDTSLDSAASYLAGLLNHAGLSYQYVPSHEAITREHVEAPWSLLILSDYPAGQFPKELQELAVERIHTGAGLLMFGGWESFHGLGGDWDTTPLGELLPVSMESRDDRWNCDRPLVVKQLASHPIVDGLPWADRPPLIGGLNRIQPAAGSFTLLSAEEFQLSWAGNDPHLAFAASHPLLVVAPRGRGRVAAFASDVAPHWVGPLVDWGTERVAAAGLNAPAIEVGNLYAEFFLRLVSWTAGRI